MFHFGLNCDRAAAGQARVTRRAEAQRRTAQPLTRLDCGGYPGFLTWSGLVFQQGRRSLYLVRSYLITTCTWCMVFGRKNNPFVSAWCLVEEQPLLSAWCLVVQNCPRITGYLWKSKAVSRGPPRKPPPGAERHQEPPLCAVHSREGYQAKQSRPTGQPRAWKPQAELRQLASASCLPPLKS